jgi:antitoxin HicB
MSATNVEPLHPEIERRLAMPYTRELIREEDGSWFASIVEFPGCMTVGTDEADALVNLRDAMIAWLASCLADGQPIPEPIEVREYSGKFMLRVPKSLHRDLARRAETEGVSLNQFVVTELARAVGRSAE